MAEPAVRAVEAWLASKNTTLFGRAFDLTQNSEAAARWFTEQIDDFLRFSDSRGHKRTT